MERTDARVEESETKALSLAGALRGALPSFTVEAGETVVRQGDAGRRFFVVESGVLDVVLTSAEGLRLPVARLGPGSHFGEMSLLAGTPVSADVVASETAVLYAATPEEFEQLVRRDPQLIDYLAGELAFRLKQTNEQLAAQQERQATLSKLVSSRPTSPFKSDLPSFSKKMMATVKQASESDLPLLIAGEKGVGKRALALHVHSAGQRRSQPVLVVDCRELPPDEARAQLFGDADPRSVSRFADHLGYLQAADRGTLVLANVDRLPNEVQEDLATFLRNHKASSEDHRVAVRVIGTAGGPVETPGAGSGLREALSQAFADGHVIQLQPLRQRRRDAVPLAEHFLEAAAKTSGRPPRRLGESARRELLAYDFRFENVEELRQAMNLAADLAEGGVVNAEHLFFGPGSGADTPQIDLLRWAWLAGLLQRGRALAGLKIVVAMVFAGIVAACLAYPGSFAGRTANLMVWGVWWPVLVISAILLGRVWCAVCPLGSGAEAIQHAKGRGLSPPDRLKRVGIALAVAGFVGIVWTEHMTAMEANPRYTALLLLSLALIAAAVGWLWQRHTWCRYLCPLGAMGAVFSVASGLRVRARREVCQGSCTGNECYKGSERAKGCPMFNHAMFLSSGQHCKICLECLRACPAQSPRLVLQPPLRDIWRSDLITTDVAPLAVVIGLVALLLAATPMGGLHSRLDRWWFSAGALAAVAVGLILPWVLTPRSGAENGSGLSWAARAVYAYAPAVAAVLFAFHVRTLPWLGESDLRIGTASGHLFGLSLLQLVQGGAVAAGGLMTLWALWRLCRLRFGPRAATALAVWVPLGLLAVGYLAGALMLLGRA